LVEKREELMRISSSALIIAVGLTCGFQPAAVRAQVIEAAIGAAAPVIGAWAVDKILKDIDNSLAVALSTAEGTGNHLLASAAEQSYNMLNQLKAALDDEREKTFEQVSNERKFALADLYLLSNRLRNGVLDDQAKIAVQIDKMLPQIRVLGKDIKFLIVRVTPPIITKEELAANPIRIFGVGFGVDQANKTFETSITIGGKTVPKDRILVKEWGLELLVHGADFGSTVHCCVALRVVSLYGVQRGVFRRLSP
jgi:hypothetical protein